MKLNVVYESPHTDWSVLHVFEGYVNLLKERGYELYIEHTNSIGTRDPNRYKSPHTLFIKNLETSKYVLISYWDNAESFFYEPHGWDLKNCMGVFTSSGVKNSLDVIPISYVSHNKKMDSYYLNSIPNSLKKNNILHFRGFLYGKRNLLSKKNKITITNEIISFEDYINELTNNKVCISFNGAAEVCNRDMEILGSRSVLFREKLNQKFHNPLIDGVHYISYDYDPDPDIQIDIIIQKFNEISQNEDLLNFISENGYKWFSENGTVESNIKIIDKVLDLNILK